MAIDVNFLYCFDNSLLQSKPHLSWDSATINKVLALHLQRNTAHTHMQDGIMDGFENGFGPDTCKESNKGQKCAFSMLTSSGAGNLTVPGLVRAALGAVAIYDRPPAGCTVLAVLWNLGTRDIVLLCSQPLACMRLFIRATQRYFKDLN